MALAYANSSNGSGATPGSTITAGIVNNANGVSIMFISYYSNGSFTSTSSITDASGGTWNLRKRVRFQSAWLGAGSTANANYIVQEIWWKNDVSSTNRNLTFNLTNNGACVEYQFLYQCITGSTTPSAPWDTNSGLLTSAQTYGDPVSTLAAITLSATTSQNNSEFIALLSEVTSTNNSTLSAAGTGMTAQNNQTNGTSPNQFHMFFESKTQATAGTATLAATQTKQSFIFTGDALSGTSTGSSASAGTIDLANLRNLSSGNNNSGTGSPATFTFTNTAPCIIVANILTQGGVGLGYVPITGVTDSAGHTWHRRSALQFDATPFQGLSNGVEFVTQEVWWANVTAAHGSNVTVSIALSNTANQASGTLTTWATFIGSMTPTAPWDVNTALGLYSTYDNAFTPTLPSKTWALSSASDLVLGLLCQYGATGNTNVSSAPAGYTFGSAHITTGNSTTGPCQNALAWTTAPQSGSGTQTWATNSTLEWTLSTDALSGDTNGTANFSQNSSGTITTTLTGASQSLSGTQTAGASGTIATNLTKISQSLSGSSTSLSFTGTIQTTLSGIGQTLNGSSIYSVSGNVTTALSGISQLAVEAEIIVGSVNTVLSGISQRVDAFEAAIFGPIVTNLSPASFAAVGEETFSGTIVTNLGQTEQGGFGNIVDAELIIEGPIVMNLQGFGQSILGGLLGTPGSGKWYSYRYLDS